MKSTVELVINFLCTSVQNLVIRHCGTDDFFGKNTLALYLL
jgi:hypothetical protein